MKKMKQKEVKKISKESIIAVNMNRLKKDEMLWLYNHRCRHGARYTEHPNCFSTEKPNSPIYEKVGILDIEASNLKATFGIVLTYCIKELNGPIISRAIEPSDIRNEIYDKNLMKKLIDDIRKFDKIVVYFGGDRRFDIPFLRSRCLFHQLDFPLYKELKVFDLYTTVRNKFCLHSNRLAVVCDYLGIASKDHPIKYDVWLGALSGKKKHLDYILTHNKEDVISTEELYKRIVNYSNNNGTSI